MFAKFLKDIEIVDTNKNMKMEVNKGEIFKAIDRKTHYELRRADGWGAMAPKECEGDIFEILEANI
ncbi:MAG: hypothetical protein U0J62_05340 [Lachnospiraceae bacterium]|nr:hypothetical protein [Lachnospiraceae bacterium]